MSSVFRDPAARGPAPHRLWRKIRYAGRIAELAPPGEKLDRAASTDADRFLSGGSVHVRHVDAGSCNGCEVEIGSAFGPVYDIERYGVGLVASPRHADVLLVTGPVTRNMEGPLQETYEAMPAPKRVVALGDCARNCGVFADGCGVVGPVSDVIPVDVEVSGCPPSPADIVEALRRLSGR